MNDNIGRRFLEEIDFYIKKNLRTLTCAQIQEFYHKFFEELKRFKGNSHGFTGLSEYLIFRSLYHLLGGSFEPKKVIDSDWTYEFISDTKNNIRIGQSIPIKINGKKIYPDIAIYSGHILKAVVQIKIVFNNGIKEVSNEIRKLKLIRNQYFDMRALLIIYELSKRSKIINELKEYRDMESWFHFIILKDNGSLVSQILTNNLNLSEFLLFP